MAEGHKPQLNSHGIKFADFTVDLQAGELRKNGTRVHLQEQPFQILVILTQRAGEVVTRQELRQHLWPADTFVDFDNSLNAAIAKIREALGDSAEAPRFIETLPRRGYRFIGSLTSKEEPSDGKASAILALPSGGSVAGRKVPSPSLRLTLERHRGKQLWVFAAAGLALVALAVLVVQLTSPKLKPRGPIDSVAVLPFVNAGAETNLDYLSDGITEGIINSLAGFPNLRVIARTSVFRYKGRDFDPKRVARALEVRAIVTGRVVQNGDGISVTAELVDISEDRQLWGQQYTRKRADLAGIQGEIASEISDRLRLRLSEQAKEHLLRHYTPDPEAYQLYLKGRYYWNTFTPEGLKKARGYFQHSIAIDPGYAPAYAGLAECYNDLGALLFGEPKDVVPKAKGAAMKALEIDESLAEAHSALGWAVWNWDWDKSAAEREFKRAIELNNNSSIAHHRYGIFLSHLGRFDEGIAEGKRARDLDPLSPMILSFVAYDYMVAGRYEEAMSESSSALALDPSNAVVQTNIPWIYALEGKYARALIACEKLPKQSLAVTAENQGPALSVAWVYAVAGRKAEAERLLKAFKQLVPREYVDPYSVAEVYAGLGDNDRTFEWLERAYRVHSVAMVWLKADPFWEKVRSDPRYEDLLRRVGLL